MIVLHGGPGAPGSAGELAALIANPARVLEPWQEARTVATHIEETRAFIEAHCHELPVLVGHSWGAMLALAYTAVHPVRAVCMVCPGTFDENARAVFTQSSLPYDVDPLPEHPLDASELDEVAHRESWNDMLRMQADGTYLAAFAAIHVPVLMVHGAEDPHPGRMICDSLTPFVPQLEYRELERCGHYPWRERQARDVFIAIVRAWVQGFAE